MADDGKVYLDANNLYLDSFKLARAIWDDGFRPTVRLEYGAQYCALCSRRYHWCWMLASDGPRSS